jgi:glutamate synthase (NADPH/NADH) large chain
VAREVREILAGMGMRSLSAIVGRSDLLTPLRRDDFSGSTRVNVEGFIQRYLGEYRPNSSRMCTRERNDNPALSLNDEIVKDIMPFIEKAEPVTGEYTIRNIDRSIPVRLNYYISRKYHDQGLPPDTIRLTFQGTAGQSFGAFNHRGLSLTLIGDANDYAGKGMFGGRIAIASSNIREPHRQVIVGNTVLYGATGGEFYAAGMAGERFAVRNSGARAVVEGAGHHLCEYMTRGVVVALGEVGYNVGAGMTGGVLYVLDRDDRLEEKINTAYVAICDLNDEDLRTLKGMIQGHFNFTGSLRAQEILADFNGSAGQFRKIAPS